ncbi:hypothetical protein DXG01_012841, partial [Tephrocybe rancida]
GECKVLASTEQGKQESQTALEKYRQDKKNLGEENQRLRDDQTKASGQAELDARIKGLEADKSQMQINLSDFKALTEQRKQESQTALEQYRQDNKNLGEENQRECNSRGAEALQLLKADLDRQNEQLTAKEEVVVITGLQVEKSDLLQQKKQLFHQQTASQVKLARYSTQEAQLNDRLVCRVSESPLYISSKGCRVALAANARLEREQEDAKEMQRGDKSTWQKTVNMVHQEHDQARRKYDLAKEKHRDELRNTQGLCLQQEHVDELKEVQLQYESELGLQCQESKAGFTIQNLMTENEKLKTVGPLQLPLPPPLLTLYRHVQQLDGSLKRRKNRLLLQLMKVHDTKRDSCILELEQLVSLGASKSESLTKDLELATNEAKRQALFLKQLEEQCTEKQKEMRGLLLQLETVKDHCTQLKKSLDQKEQEKEMSRSSDSLMMAGEEIKTLKEVKSPSSAARHAPLLILIQRIRALDTEAADQEVRCAEKRQEVEGLLHQLVLAKDHNAELQKSLNQRQQEKETSQNLDRLMEAGEEIKTLKEVNESALDTEATDQKALCAEKQKETEELLRQLETVKDYSTELQKSLDQRQQEKETSQNSDSLTKAGKKIMTLKERVCALDTEATDQKVLCAEKQKETEELLRQLETVKDYSAELQKSLDQRKQEKETSRNLHSLTEAGEEIKTLKERICALETESRVLNATLNMSQSKLDAATVQEKELITRCLNSEHSQLDQRQTEPDFQTANRANGNNTDIDMDQQAPPDSMPAVLSERQRGKLREHQHESQECHNLPQTPPIVPVNLFSHPNHERVDHDTPAHNYHMPASAARTGSHGRPVASSSSNHTLDFPTPSQATPARQKEGEEAGTQADEMFQTILNRLDKLQGTVSPSGGEGPTKSTGQFIMPPKRQPWTVHQMHLLKMVHDELNTLLGIKKDAHIVMRARGVSINRDTFEHFTQETDTPPLLPLKLWFDDPKAEWNQAMSVLFRKEILKKYPELDPNQVEEQFIKRIVALHRHLIDNLFLDGETDVQQDERVQELRKKENQLKRQRKRQQSISEPTTVDF